MACRPRLWPRESRPQASLAACWRLQVSPVVAGAWGGRQRLWSTRALLPAAAATPPARLPLLPAVAAPVVCAAVCLFAMFILWRRIDHRNWRGVPEVQPKKGKRAGREGGWGAACSGTQPAAPSAAPALVRASALRTGVVRLSPAPSPQQPQPKQQQQQQQQQQQPHHSSCSSHFHAQAPPHDPSARAAVPLILPRSVKIPVVVLEPDRSFAVGYHLQHSGHSGTNEQPFRCTLLPE